jgi:type IV pilus assembly protein PilM
MSPRSVSVGSWLASPPPAVAVEIRATRIVAVAIGEQGGGRVVSAYASEPLAATVAEPALNAANVHDARALGAGIASVLQQIGQRIRKVALVLPDTVAKVSLLRFDKVPAKAQDLEQLIRWQVRKSAPFRIEDAQVAWQPALPQPGGGREYLVTIARRDIVRSYEQACDAAGVHAGLVDIATFNQINAVLASGQISGDWLLVNVAADYATIALVRSGDVIFFRNRAAASEGELADLVHQTAMYHEDRLGGGGFTRVVLAGASIMGIDEMERFRRTLGERIGVPVDAIDVRPAVDLRDRIAVGPDVLDVLAPGVGILLRERAQPAASRAVSAPSAPEVA